MIRLRPRTAADCDVVVSWVPDADALHLFTGPRLRWPLDAAQLVEMETVAGFSAWMLVEDRTDMPVGHFDLIVDDGVARIGRVLIDPARRGQGLAHTLIALAIERAKSLGVSELRLNVIVSNEPAIRTYERAGFTTLPDPERAGIHSMTLSL